MVKAVTQKAPDVEIGWSRRRHASRRRSGGVRHNTLKQCLQRSRTKDSCSAKTSLAKSMEFEISCNFAQPHRIFAQTNESCYMYMYIQQRQHYCLLYGTIIIALCCGLFFLTNLQN